MSICRVISCVAGRGYLLWSVHSLDKTLLAFALLPFVLQGKTCLLLQVSLYFLHLHSSPLWWKEHLLGMLVLEGLVGLHRTVQLQLLQHYWLGYRLGLLWYWMVCLRNELRSFCCFEIASKYCLLDSSVDYDGYSISSKKFLPTVVDTMVIWIKFAYSISILVYWFLKCRCSLLPSPVWSLLIYLNSWT